MLIGLCSRAVGFSEVFVNFKVHTLPCIPLGRSLHTRLNWSSEHYPKLMKPNKSASWHWKTPFQRNHVFVNPRIWFANFNVSRSLLDFSWGLISNAARPIARCALRLIFFITYSGVKRPRCCDSPSPEGKSGAGVPSANVSR